MTAYDLCAVEWLPDWKSLFRDNRSARITLFSAAGELSIRCKGEER